MLQQIGMRAEWTTSGKGGRSTGPRAPTTGGDSYHTISFDWQMPELSGIETTRRIRAAIGRDAPIIILTAYDWTDIEEGGPRGGRHRLLRQAAVYVRPEIRLLAATT